MNNRLLGLLGLSILLSACSATTDAPLTLSDRLRNPLFANQYWADLTDRMVTLQINEIDALKKNNTDGVVDEARKTALAKAQEASRVVNRGYIGDFVPVMDPVMGKVLWLNDRVYFGFNTSMIPGPSMHVYLTTALDPRDLNFPDPSSVDLGPLASPYGAQEYIVPEHQEDLIFRSVVLYDTQLKRVNGFAQIAKPF